MKAEMKVKDFEVYRAAYCGVCKQLQKSYGLVSRFLLNYDLVLVALMSDGISGEKATVQHEGCIANPVSKRCAFHNTEGLQLASDGLIMLSYFKLCDNIEDETFFKGIAYRLAKPFFKGKYKKARVRRPELAQVLAQQMDRQREIELESCQSVDLASEPTAKMCQAIFAAGGTTPEEKETLGRLGLFAGQIVYILDAAEDYEQDKKQGRYNVFVNLGYTRKQAIQAAKLRCRMAAGEIAACYSTLQLSQYKDILDNIFYLGLPAGIANAGGKEIKRRPKHGQIESL